MNNIFDISSLNEAQKERLIYKIGIAIKNLNDLDFIQVYNEYAEMVNDFSIEENTPENVNRYFRECPPWELLEMVRYGNDHYHTSDKWFTVNPGSQGLESSNDPKAIAMNAAEDMANEMISEAKATSYGVKAIEKLITEAVEESKKSPKFKIDYKLKLVTVDIIDADYIDNLLKRKA